MIDEEKVKEKLEGLKHPRLGKSLLELGMIRDIGIVNGTVNLTLALKNDRSSFRGTLEKKIKDCISSVEGVAEVRIEVTTLSREEIERLFPEQELKGIKQVERIIAVASGKGGVGKTTVAVNLALALHQQGFRTGLMDADIYGPSIPIMLDLYNQADFSGDVAKPLEKYGLRIMSLGMSAKQDQAFIWRGPLVSKMIHNLLDKVEWGRLDYLVVDLPPGTGDPSISVAHSIPDAEIVMVTTPQKLALADVRRAVNLFNLYHLNIIGLVENMSYFACGHGDKVFDIFGRGGGEELSRESDIPLLGSIPLDLAVRKSEDSGKPLMVGAPDSEAGRTVQDIAGKISGKRD